MSGLSHSNIQRALFSFRHAELNVGPVVNSDGTYNSYILLSPVQSRNIEKVVGKGALNILLGQSQKGTLKIEIAQKLLGTNYEV